MEIKTTLDIWKIKYGKFKDGISTKKWVAVDDLIKHFNEYKPSGSSYIDRGIMEFIGKLKEKLCSQSNENKHELKKDIDLFEDGKQIGHDESIMDKEGVD